MAINFRLLQSAVIALTLFFALASFAAAQGYNPEHNSGYFLDPNSEEPRFIQRLVWSGGEYTLRYEVIIERREGRIYRKVLQEFTEEAFIEVSLAPGYYRFCVIPYDLLERPGDSTDWVNIEVRHALNPNLVDSSQALIKEGKKTYLYLDIFAYSVDPEAEIFLRASNGRIIGPEEVEFFDDGGFRLTYDSSIISSGKYEVYVKNPGGLEDSLGIVYIEPESKFNVNITGAYMPVFNIYGKAPDWVMALTAAALRVNAVYHFPAFYIGPELTSAFYISPADELILSSELYLLLGKMMANKKTALNIRFGAGYSLLLSVEEFQGIISVNTGISFFWLIVKHFYMELGADYVHQFSDAYTGSMRPWIGLGVQF